MFVISLYNLKGGVGKTTSCVNFAYMAGIAGAGSTQLACLVQPFSAYAPTTSACRFQTIYVNGSVIGASTVSVAFFR